MKQFYLYFLLFFVFQSGISQDISIGKRDAMYSEILQQNREFSIYLPPSYNTAINQKYPVLYILDGDYNFQYVAGFLELQGAISEVVPEMILVAISGKGTTEYRKNCKPNVAGVEDSGNAEEMTSFIAKELIPYINKNYKASDYKILGGHSAGGIFIVNTALNHPNLFNNYIAISPALYWGNNAMEVIMKNTWGATESTTANVYFSLANEKGMGVARFLKKVPKKIMDKNVKFQEFPDENHNSVGLLTYKWALSAIFEKWFVEKEYFASAVEMKNHYAEVQSLYGSIFNIPYTVIGNTHYMLQKDEMKLKEVQAALKELNPNGLVLFNTYRAGKLIAEKKYDEAESLLNEALTINPNNFDSYNVLAKVKLAKGDTEGASTAIKKGLDFAKQQEARQWQINELQETRDGIPKK
ncbi:alpha/beta hydrolase-fold protein [Aequorivita sp. Q41]|uniref:alpha/beta hydrolase-fold protein n=1 Tax=Aequorivita sp. Q41 TaxID=3153300 RepID=UPI00324287A3